MEKAREFCLAVKKLNEKFDMSFFFVTEGASITDNRGCEAVKHARTCHEEWEKEHGFDPEEEWDLNGNGL